MSELNENVIIHFITRQCPEEELKQINEWLAEDQRHAQYLLQMERIYQHLQSRSMPQWKVEEALERVHGNAGAALPHQERHSFRRRWHRYAAAIVLAILAGTALLWYGKVLRADDGRAYIVAQTNGSTTKQVLLPDGSKVWLNHHSSLSYPERFEGDVRKVLLTGEGYFEVSKDGTRPFIVENDAMAVKVLGTVFDFKNDAANMRSEVSLLKGSVEVKSNVSAGQMVLVPGQKAQLDYQTGHMTVSNMEDGVDAVWHTNLIPFSNATIKEIVGKLEKIYGVRMVIGANVDLRSTYSGTIKYNKDLDLVLHLLQNTLPIAFKKTRGGVYSVNKAN